MTLLAIVGPDEFLGYLSLSIGRVFRFDWVLDSTRKFSPSLESRTATSNVCGVSGPLPSPFVKKLLATTSSLDCSGPYKICFCERLVHTIMRAISQSKKQPRLGERHRGPSWDDVSFPPQKRPGTPYVLDAFVICLSGLEHSIRNIESFLPDYFGYEAC